MTGLAEASAFLDHFLRTEWGSCHVRTGGLELFVSRRADHANPMAARAEPAAPSPVSGTVLRAPHIGTVASLAAVGTTVAAGEAYATLTVLDEVVPLTAIDGGTVLERLATIGSLAEHDQPLVALG